MPQRCRLHPEPTNSARQAPSHRWGSRELEAHANLQHARHPHVASGVPLSHHGICIGGGSRGGCPAIRCRCCRC
eukprot:2651555-Amphidinium_carterae.1